MKAQHITRTENGYALNGLECVGLPRAQSHALLLRAQGRSFADAAEALGCSIQNVKNAIATLFYKLRADSSPELVTRAFESGFLRVLTLVAAAGRMTDAEAREPSLLPGWTRGHVLTHVARNADALTNLLSWAAASRLAAVASRRSVAAVTGPTPAESAEV
jgi:DNA-binding CsgD family transcriptional regulator